MKKDQDTGVPAQTPQEKKRQDKSRNGSTETTVEYNTDFMVEEIKRRPVNKRKLVKKTVTTVFQAILFGAVACLVFIVLEPVINSAIYPTEEVTQVSFPEETEEEEMSPEDMIADDQQFQESAAEEMAEEMAEEIAASNTDTIKQEVLEEVLQQLEEDASQSTTESNDMVALYYEMIEALNDITNMAAKSIVTVTCITPDYDWVGDSYNNTGSVSGLVIAERGTDLLVLANDENFAEVNEIRITFANEETAAAQLMCTDPITGLSVLSVDEADLKAQVKDGDEIRVCTLGSSAQSSLLGNLIIAVGSPSGTQGSINYGVVTNTDLLLDVTDGAFRQITTDIYGSTTATGIIVDAQGRVMGWIDMDHNSSDSPNLISAIGITELKTVIEKMSNTISMGYLGIHGTEVPEAIRLEYGIPEGAYVVRTEMDSPAMEAGIQSGDVITKMDDKEITCYQDAVDALEQMTSGQTLVVTVMRISPDGYDEISLNARLGERFVFPE